ncbi:MAG: glycosyltransferase family 4 protein [Gammaproteobacteria bacterium]
MNKLVAMASLGGFTVLATLWLTGRVRAWALARAVIDRPNARSLHVVPTPRGGGLAIVGVVAPLEALLIATFDVGSAWAWGSWLYVLALAVLGLRDDLGPLPARLRLVLQFALAGAWVIGATSSAGGGPALLTMFLMVWVVNLFNFMDGTDGFAVVQAIVACAAGGVFAYLAHAPAIAAGAWLVAAGCAGFLFWNWAPARIFLGDVGSYYLGGHFAVACASVSSGGRVPWTWLILLGPFIVDATLTLVRRVSAGDAWMQAHRTHAYQLLATAGWSHRRLALALAALLLGWCVPWAIIAVLRPALAPMSALACHVVLFALWWRIVRAHLAPTA